MKKITISILFTVVLGLFLAGCSNESSSESGGEPAQEITVNAMSEPPSLDPAMATDTTSGWIMEHLFEGLYTKNQDGEIVKGLQKK